MIVLAITIRCKKEKIREAVGYFSAFVPRARGEQGCIQYDLFQAKDDPSVFYFFEKWADKKHLICIASSPH